MNLQTALDILGLSQENLTLDKVKQAYRQKAQTAHPDKGGNSKDFIQVRKAYIFLRDGLINGQDFYQKMRENSDFQNSNQQYQNNYHQKNQTEGDFWKQKYLEVFQEMQNFQNKFQAFSGLIQIYERQINSLVEIFNQGQINLKLAQSQLLMELRSIDELYKKELEKLKNRYHKTWGDLFLGRKKLTKYEYTTLHNDLIRQINQLEQDKLNTHNRKIQKMYQDILNSFYEVLSE